VADETAATGTDAWAAQLTGSTAAVMRGGLWLARVLEEKYDATREAFAAGGIIEAQVTDEQRAVAEAALVAKAVDGMDARGLRQAARGMLAVISAELAGIIPAGLARNSASSSRWLKSKRSSAVDSTVRCAGAS
jgi:hypothetical protein